MFKVGDKVTIADLDKETVATGLKNPGEITAGPIPADPEAKEKDDKYRVRVTDRNGDWRDLVFPVSRLAPATGDKSLPQGDKPSTGNKTVPDGKSTPQGDKTASAAKPGAKGQPTEEV